VLSGLARRIVYRGHASFGTGEAVSIRDFLRETFPI